MYYDLEILDTLVLNKLNPSSTYTLSDDSMEDSSSIALAERSDFPNRVYDTIFNIQGKKLIKLYIRRHHGQLIHLSDTLHSYIVLNEQKLDAKASTTTLIRWESTLQTIGFLITFIESTFSDMLNPNQNIPKQLRLDMLTKSAEYLAYIEQFKNPSTSKFIAIATDPLHELFSQQETTYRQYQYWKELTKQYMGFKSQSTESDYALYLRNRLFRINFNTLTFVYYLSDEILRIIDLLETDQDKVAKLLWYHKYISQHHIYPGLAYNPKGSTIKEYLLRFVDDEIDYRKTSLVPLLEEILAGLPHGKFETTLTVNQYALLVSAIYEAHIFINISKVKFSEGCASIVITKGSSNVSPKNMRNKMYNPSLQDQEFVREILVRMLNYLQRLNLGFILLYFFRDYNFLEFYTTP